MPTPIVDLGDPYMNLLHAFWKAVGEDLRGEAPIFGHVSSKHRRLPACKRATIEKEIARQRAVAFVESTDFPNWVEITSRLTDTDIEPALMLEALHARN